MVMDLAVCSGSAARSRTGEMHKRVMASSKRRQFMARECTRLGREVARRRATHRPHSVVTLKLLSAAGRALTAAARYAARARRKLLIGFAHRIQWLRFCTLRQERP